MRVISLLPAATEIMDALGLSEQLVGVSHECVLPAGLQELSRVTRSDLLEQASSSAEIDEQVRAAIAVGEPLYTLDERRIRELRPDVILTQRLCDVCAVEHGSVAALAASLSPPPEVVSLEPVTLEGVFADIGRVAAHLRAPERGEALVASLRSRVEAVRTTAARAGHRPRCVLLEWLDPLFGSGHWNPQLVEIAGGREMIGRAGEHSRAIEWDAVRSAAPEVLLIVCCGYGIERTLEDLPLIQSLPGWDSLPAVQQGRVHVADGAAHFTVPGPRLVDSLEMVAWALHPGLFADQAGSGWHQVS